MLIYLLRVQYQSTLEGSAAGCIILLSGAHLHANAFPLQVSHLQGQIQQMAEDSEAESSRQAVQLQALVQHESQTWDQLCR